MLVKINRTTDAGATLIALSAIASVDCVEQPPAAAGGETRVWLLISGSCQRQWFVAERAKSQVAELIAIRDQLQADWLAGHPLIQLNGTDPPT
jgi:hypothetical protein